MGRKLTIGALTTTSLHRRRKGRFQVEEDVGSYDDVWGSADDLAGDWYLLSLKFLFKVRDNKGGKWRLDQRSGDAVLTYSFALQHGQVCRWDR